MFHPTLDGFVRRWPRVRIGQVQYEVQTLAGFMAVGALREFQFGFFFIAQRKGYENTIDYERAGTVECSYPKANLKSWPTLTACFIATREREDACLDLCLILVPV